MKKIFNVRHLVLLTILSATVSLSACGYVEGDHDDSDYGFPDASPNAVATVVSADSKATVTTAEKAEVTTKKTTTTAKVTTTNKATTTQKKPEEVKTNTNLSKLRTLDYFDGLGDDPYNITIKIKDTSTGKLFKNTDSWEQWIFFNLSDNGIVGSGLTNTSSATVHDYENNVSEVACTETYFGIKAEIKNNRTLSVESYSHLNGVKLTDIKIQADRDVNVMSNYTVDVSKGTLTADLYDDYFSNGLYAITATYEFNSTTCSVNLYMFVNCKSDSSSDYHFYICNGISDRSKYKYTPTERRKQITDMINNAGITPENSLNPNVAYPYEAGNLADYDTQYWKDLSYEIINGHENASDAFKSTLLHDWMTSHLIYDDYKANYLPGPRYKNDYASKKYYMSRINVGVCRDFSNVYTIMCREQGIPCIMLDTDTHVWNVICIDGQWIEVDLTTDVSRHAYSEDYTDITGSTYYNYSAYCNYNCVADPEGVNTYLHIY